MRLWIIAMTLILAGTLSCGGMMEDFQEYSGAEFRTSVYIGTDGVLFYSHDGGTSFTQYVPVPGNVVWQRSYYVNPFREIMMTEYDNSVLYPIFIQGPDGTKRPVSPVMTTPGVITAAVNGDFYYYTATVADNQLYRLPSGETMMQPVSGMLGVPTNNLNPSFWVLNVKGTTLIFVNDTSGTYSLWRSVDGGFNFSNVAPPGFTSTVVDMVLKGKQVFFLSAAGEVYVSNDGGGSFTPSPVYVFAGLTKLTADNQGRLYALSDMIHFSDDGITWNSQPTFSPGAIVTGLETDHNNRLYILCSATGGFLFSDDRGLSTYSVNAMMGANLQVVEYHD